MIALPRQKIKQAGISRECERDHQSPRTIMKMPHSRLFEAALNRILDGVADVRLSGQ